LRRMIKGDKGSEGDGEGNAEINCINVGVGVGSTIKSKHA